MFVYAIVSMAAMAGLTQAGTERTIPLFTPVIYAPPPAPGPFLPTYPNLPKSSSGTQNDPIPANNPSSWVTTDDYPMTALREQRVGVTAVELSIDVDGKVTNCVVTASSGSIDLDEATCSNLLQRARFYAAQDRKGKKIAGTWRNRVRWQIPDYDPDYLGSFVGNNIETENYPSAAYPDSWDWTMPKEADFPVAAWSEKRTGRSALRLDIDISGKVTKCTVKETSGYDDLDQKGCALAKERATYIPAKDIEGNNTPARKVEWIIWMIPSEATNQSTSYKRPLQNNLFLKSINSQIAFTVESDGSVSDCMVDETGEQKLEGKLPICKTLPTASPVFTPFADANGKPERRRVKVRINMETEKVTD